MKKDVYRGYIPILNKVSDREINQEIIKWRKQYPNESITSNELRPYMVNSIIKQRKLNGTYNPNI